MHKKTCFNQITTDKNPREIMENSDKPQVLSRGGAVRGSNIQITADMTRTMREGWGELTKFMARVPSASPSASASASL